MPDQTELVVYSNTILLNKIYINQAKRVFTDTLKLNGVISSKCYSRFRCKVQRGSVLILGALDYIVIHFIYGGER